MRPPVRPFFMNWHSHLPFGSPASQKCVRLFDSRHREGYTYPAFKVIIAKYSGNINARDRQRPSIENAIGRQPVAAAPLHRTVEVHPFLPVFGSRRFAWRVLQAVVASSRLNKDEMYTLWEDNRSQKTPRTISDPRETLHFSFRRHLSNNLRSLTTISRSNR